MARKRKKGRRAAKKKINILPIVGLAPAAMRIPIDYNAGGKTFRLVLNNQVAYWTGFVPDRGVWEPKWMAYGLAPFALGIAGSMVASKFGLNKVLSRQMSWLPIRL